jgi:hypothetical protein
VVREDDAPPSWPQPVESGVDGIRKDVQLVVDRHAHRLECPTRGMSSGAAGGRRDRRPDHVGEL